jgi:hypothetical protein
MIMGPYAESSKKSAGHLKERHTLQVDVGLTLDRITASQPTTLPPQPQRSV